MYCSVMTEFYDRAAEEYKLLEGMHAKMESLYSDLAMYFSFEAKQYPMEECFGDLKLFKDQYLQAAAENAARREMEEKARRAQEQKDKSKEEKRRRASNKIVLPQGQDQNELGLMDDLLKSLHSGQAFVHNRKRQAGNLKPHLRKEQLSRSRSRGSLDKGSTESPDSADLKRKRF